VCRELREDVVKVLITGGAGFIGSHAVHHFLSCDDDVFIVDKLTYAGKLENLDDMPRPFTFENADICDVSTMRAVFRENRFDVVVNFAAETHVDNSIRDSAPFVQTNLAGATVLMDLAREYETLFCQLSTDEVYGDAVDSDIGFETTDPLRPRNPYSVTKAAADMMLLSYHNTFKQSYLIFRPSNNFGPRQHAEKFLPKLVETLISYDAKAIFPLYGDGRQVREWTYAGDTVKAIRDTIVTGERNRILNISSGFSLENIETIRRVVDVLDERGYMANPERIKHVEDRLGHDRRYWIESDIPTNAFTPFDVALKKTIDHYYQRFA